MWHLIGKLTPVFRVVKSPPCSCQGLYRIKRGTFKTKIYCGSCRVLLIIAYHLWPMF